MASRGRGAKQKGNQFEREISDWISNLTGVRYRRTPNSGAMRMDFPFDLQKVEQKPSPLDGVGIECKDQKTLAIPAWIKQIEGECIDAGKNPNKWFLIFNIRGKRYVVLPQDYYGHLLSLDKLE